MVRFTAEEIASRPGGFSAKHMRKMVEEKFFKEHGCLVTRWKHEYLSLNGNHPKLGLVYLQGDSIVTETIEVWGLFGHNLREARDEAG